MGTVISSVLAFFITIPIFAYLFLFIAFKMLTKNHRKSVRMAIDYSTLLFILAVHFLIVTIWGTSFMSFILLFMCMTAITLAIIHWKTKGEIVLSHFFRGFWRFHFLLFFIAYISLLLFGILNRAVQYAEIF